MEFYLPPLPSFHHLQTDAARKSFPSGPTTAAPSRPTLAAPENSADISASRQFRSTTPPPPPPSSQSTPPPESKERRRLDRGSTAITGTPVYLLVARGARRPSPVPLATTTGCRLLLTPPSEQIQPSKGQFKVRSI